MDQDSRRHVVVTDIRMPFWSMVTFMVKWVVASIPAFLILGMLWALLMVLGGMLGRMGGWRHF
jgi:ABC-type sugar transport system permease subunit